MGTNVHSFPIKNEQKLPKVVYIIPNFLVRHIGENFMKILTKIPQLQMHEKLHKTVIENTFLCNFSWILMVGIESNKHVTDLHR